MSENNKSNLDESLIAELLANRVGSESAPKDPEPEIGITEDLSKVADSGLTAAGKNAADIIDSFMNEGDRKEVIQKQLDAEFDAARDSFRPAPFEKSTPADEPLEVGDVFLDSKKSLDEVISIENYQEPAPAEVEEPVPAEAEEPATAEADEKSALDEVLVVPEVAVETEEPAPVEAEAVQEPAETAEEVVEPEEAALETTTEEQVDQETTEEPVEAEDEVATMDEKIKANIEELNKLADGFLEEGFSATADATAKSIAALSAALSKNAGISFVPSGANGDSEEDARIAKLLQGSDELENKENGDVGQLNNQQVDNVNTGADNDMDAETDVQEEEQGGSILRTILYTILTIGLLIAAILSVGLTVAKDTGFGRAVQSGVDKVQAIFTGEEDEAGDDAAAEANAGTGTEAGTESNTAAGNAGAGTNADSTGSAGTDAANTDADADAAGADATDTTEEGEKHAEIKVTDSVIGKAIQAQVEKSKNIDLIEENIELKFPAFTIEGVEGADKAIAFDDDFWYVHNNTETKHYSTEIVGFAIDYYSKLMERYNNGNEDILRMIEKDTMLMNGVAAIKSDHLVTHTITKMEIGEMRKLDDQLYLILTITEHTSDQNADTTYTKVMHFNTANTDLKVKEIGDAKPIG